MQTFMQCALLVTTRPSTACLFSKFLLLWLLYLTATKWEWIERDGRWTTAHFVWSHRTFCAGNHSFLRLQFRVSCVYMTEADMYCVVKWRLQDGKICSIASQTAFISNSHRILSLWVVHKLYIEVVIVSYCRTWFRIAEGETGFITWLHPNWATPQ